jgi:hypothetical protein
MSGVISLKTIRTSWRRAPRISTALSATAWAKARRCSTVRPASSSTVMLGMGALSTEVVHMGDQDSKM